MQTPRPPPTWQAFLQAAPELDMCILHCLFCGSGSHDHLRCIRLSLERNLLKRSAAQGRGCEMFLCRQTETLKKWSVCWRGEWPEVWGSQPTRNNYEISTHTVRSEAWHCLPPFKAGQPVLVTHRAAQQWLINDLLTHFHHMAEASFTSVNF